MKNLPIHKIKNMTSFWKKLNKKNFKCKIKILNDYQKTNLIGNHQNWFDFC